MKDAERRRGRTRPFRLSGARRVSRLEVGLLLVLIGALSTLALQRLEGLQAEVERASIQHTVAAMQSALAMSWLASIVQASQPDASTYHRSNALELLAPPPVAYIGPIEPAAMPPPGSWYYVPATGVIGYRLRFPKLILENADTDRLRWRVKASSSEREIPRLQPLDNPSWRE